MEFLRAAFTGEGIVACEGVSHANDKRRVRCAGVVLVRQRPGSSKGVVFMTLEDETGIANIVVWPKVMEKFRKEVMGARLIEVEGTIQSSPDEVVHLVAERLMNLANDALGRKHAVPDGANVIEPIADELPVQNGAPPHKMRHPRNVRILPRSRDFH
jgi:error-prone DNA polymerase